MAITDQILTLSVPTAQGLCRQVAERVRARRLELNLTQEGMAKRAGLTLSTYRRFEQTGAVSLEGLARVALVLRREDDFGALFSGHVYRTTDDVVRAKFNPRKKGQIND